MVEHSFVENVCRYCGARYNPGEDQRTCVSHVEKAAAPRPTPTSIFSEIDPIYNRIQELKKERDEMVSRTTVIE